MSQPKLVAAVCGKCHKVRTEQVQPGIFVCRYCGLVIAYGESANSMGKCVPVVYPIEDLGREVVGTTSLRNQ